MKIRFQGFAAEVRQNRYTNGRTRLDLVDPEDGSPVATASVNLPEEPLAPDEVAIKDHSENAGLCQALVDAGVVQPTGRVIVSGFVELPVCRLVRPA